MNTAYRPDSSPSFSSTLLDAIYRSIDKDEGCSRRTTKAEFHAVREPDLQRRSTSTTREQTATTATADVVLPRAYRPCNIQMPQKRLLNLASSTSESSYGELSSSDGESVVLPVGRKPHRLPALPATSSPTSYRNVPKEGRSFSDRFKMTKSCCSGGAASMVAKKAKIKAPSSPGSRLSRILNTLCSTIGQQKKTHPSASASKTLNDSPPPPGINVRTRGHLPHRSTSCSRKIPSIHGVTAFPKDGRRYVDLSSVDDNVRGNREMGGHKNGASPPTNSEVRARQHRPRHSTSFLRTNRSVEGEMPSSWDDKKSVKINSTVDNERRGQREVGAGGVPPMSTETARDPCGETGKIIFGFLEVEEDIFDGDWSDESSDLFELKGLTTNGGGRWNDELSVSEATPT